VNKISEIFKSWVTAANPTPEEQTIAQYRANVCDSCFKKEYPKPGKEACPLAKWEK